MKYMILIATDTEPGAPAETPDEIESWHSEGVRRGIRESGGILSAVSEAKTLRVRDEQLLITDGPFTESKEWIAGFDILDCSDIEEAIDYASRHPMARRGRIEIRPVTGLD